jgi:hypothetical protein
MYIETHTERYKWKTGEFNNRKRHTEQQEVNMAMATLMLI